MNPKNAIIYAIAILLCFGLYSYGVKHSNLLLKKKQQQERELRSLSHVLEIYDTLLPIKERWHNEFENIRHVNDILGLYNIINFEKYGLEIKPDELHVDSISRLTENGEDSGIVSIEISDEFGTGIQVKSTSFDDLLEKIYLLLKNKNVGVEKIKLIKRNNELFTVLYPFSVYLTDL